MSFAIRNLSRQVARAPSRLHARPRTFATADKSVANNAFEKYLQEDKALTHHAQETTDLWRKISFYVCIPAIAVCVAWVYNAEVEHAAHIEHLKHENGGELPETPLYDYLNRRSKPFPWGNNSLFFNPKVNKDMSE
ncbi:Cytochrome c oxidase subunit 13, mitochondrial [Psilocybe cubensis]|uniref:Cytochrome c oxidase subunit 13, mitochondrial n=2 Tax=Psilocybe cubensis TaxID=181762 RepID=A0ACB8HI91_PSICU|nr:Cytochrome c oxidase subunit 13, mitochondrial [Psilocybe cubensis]KAH9487039.1 Cytochrome c oxidase subunit 13, mitochondrial [Psilocybe cubensis]